MLITSIATSSKYIEILSSDIYMMNCSMWMYISVLVRIRIRLFANLPVV